jgi:glycine hydroxymethyltransferase
MNPTLQQQDPEIAKIIISELQRQRDGAEMIASENFVSQAVLEANGSILTNKYSEGYPGKRYYGGNEFIDQAETLAIERAKQLFGAQHVNVQPLSGAPANIAVYSALLQPGDTVLGMDLSHGGHLTHGHPVTYMAKLYNFIRYKTVKETGLIDYDEIERLATEHKPKLILVGYSAYSRDIDYQRIKTIADRVGALTMADIAHIAGLIAAGLMNNPVPLFDIVTTTTHKTLRGPRGGMIMCQERHAAVIDKAVFPGLQGGPHENLIAAKAVAFGEALQPEYKLYCQQILKNTKVLERIFKEHAFGICFQGTDNHLLLLDVTPLGLSGKEAQDLLDAANITVNKNMIPDDPRKPMDPSGIRLGTPALTTRGLKEAEMEIIGQTIVDILTKKITPEIGKGIVNNLMSQFPLYPNL